MRSVTTEAESADRRIESAEALLVNLRKRLDRPVSWDLKRQLVEAIVSGIRVSTFEREGPKQCRITVDYRFSEPGEALPVISQAYEFGATPTAEGPKTVGDHIRRARIRQRLRQADVAERIGVDETSIVNWESGRTEPAIKYIPAIVQFLGCNPLPVGTGWAARLVRARTTLGLSQREAARKIKVDPSTLARWERDECRPAGELAARARHFLAAVPRTSRAAA